MPVPGSSGAEAPGWPGDARRPGRPGAMLHAELLAFADFLEALAQAKKQGG